MGKINRKRVTAALLLAVALIAAACGGDAGGNGDAGDGKIRVVTSFYPIYFLASQIGGEHANVVNLIPAGVEPHDWTPKSRDLTQTSNAGLFLYNGAGLEGWVDDFLQGAGKNGSLVTMEVSEGIALIDGEGHEETEEGHGHEEGEAHDHGNVDPHTWVSPKSALVMAANVRDAFVDADEAHKADYEANYIALKERLEKLDAAFEETLKPLPRKQIVVSHQAFAYLCRDYGLEQKAIMGLAPDAEPRARDMLEIADFVRGNGVKVIFFEELVSPDLAETIARETGAETLVLNPLEGLTPEQEAAGEDFVTLMEDNLQNLVKALQ